MVDIAIQQPVPITVTATGGWRVEGTRVPVEAILREFHAGATAEQILDSFPTVGLAKIYSVIGYCLSHIEIVDRYLGETAVQEINAGVKHGNDSRALQLKARLAALKATGTSEQ
jgi:uncharacterized protein (DUF433 family)